MHPTTPVSPDSQAVAQAEAFWAKFVQFGTYTAVSIATLLALMAIFLT